MYAKIAVPLDGSALAERALHTAEAIARATGAEMYLVSVLDGPPDPSTSLLAPSFLVGEVTEQHRQRLDYLQGQAQRIAGRGIAVHTEIIDASGDVCGTLLAFEQRENIDLTVLATHGRRGLTRWSLGSVAERLVQNGRVPVFLVRAAT